MPLVIYRKAPPQTVTPAQRTLPLFPALLMVFGSLVIGSVAGPIVGYLVVTAPGLQQRQGLTSPLPFTPAAEAATPVVFQRIDYRKPENWFPSTQLPKPNPSRITHYNLSIPKLRIQNAVVEIAGSDLEKSLIQYPGTASPGEYGAPVVFGHSILRQFYNPERYLSIFSTIMTLSHGDEIKINFDGVEYAYRVVDKLEVQPNDIQILEQRYDGRFLKLVTCVPEGTYLRRGIIVAALEQT